MNKTIITNSYEETQRFAKEVIKKYNNKRIFALYGDLGSGKTTFVQGLANGLGIENKIISPSFIIMRSYKIKNLKLKIQNYSEKYKMFYHVDLYRIKSDRDIAEIGLFDLMSDKENLFAIEWPEKILKYLPKETVDVYFEYIEESSRKLKLLF